MEKNNKNNGNNKKSGFKFLYYGQDDEQIEFYIKHGLKPAYEDIHHKTGRKFAAFPFDKSGYIWKLWQEHTKERYERGDFRKNK